MLRKALGLIAFVSTGAGLLGGTIMKGTDVIQGIGILAIIGFCAIGLTEHYKELMK